MCGIAGYIHLERERPVSNDIVRRMTDTLRHRGPDGEGYFVHRNLALGHRRLAIIDLSTGDQPMFNDDSTIALIYNGEIYNYVELREELRGRGSMFRTASDTEVIIRAYEQWGTDCLLRFNGMWSFALWDGPKERLFCARDRLGEKPLYYSITNGTFAFASEPKALFAYGVPKKLNEEMLDAYLCFGFLPAPCTMFNNIAKLPPGHFLLVEGGQVKTRPYWDVRFPADHDSRRDEKEILEEFETLFLDAVRIRMRSDVPFGAFLSGGLDSSSVVAAMSRSHSGPVKTFTIGFGDPQFDERALAALVAKRFRTDHVERLVKPGEAETLLQKIASHFDEPFGDPSALPTYLVSKIARERVTVVLTGDGGDEVLSGYTIHQGQRFSERYSTLPPFIGRAIIPGLLSAAVHLAGGGLRQRIRRAQRVVKNANLEFVDRLEAKQGGFTSRERTALLASHHGIRPARSFIEEAIAPVSGRDDFTKLDYWLLKVSLADDMLCKVDRASMASSLETRVPFLDHRIVELMAGVCMDVKLKGFTRKHVLRESIGKDLPREILDARKHGFDLPLSTWFRDSDANAIERHADHVARNGLIDRRALQGFLGEVRSGERDGSAPLWALAMLAFSVD